jgi:predicted ATPase with chaperone activity
LYNKSNTYPCAYYGDAFRECKCSSGEISRYHKRISGPLLDRFDIIVVVPHMDYEKLKVISRALGRSSVAFTMDVYSHTTEGMQHNAMMLLDGVLPKARNGVSTEK